MFSLLSPLLLAPYVHHLLAHASNNRVRALSANSSFSFRTFWSFEPEPPKRQRRKSATSPSHATPATSSGLTEPPSAPSDPTRPTSSLSSTEGPPATSRPAVTQPAQQPPEPVEQQNVSNVASKEATTHKNSYANLAANTHTGRNGRPYRRRTANQGEKHKERSTSEDHHGVCCHTEID